ncbi:MAG: CoA-binding protein [Proteobacteria bacterium]|nr:CoA-binding protein [Pseudomonadota bacterium]
MISRAEDSPLYRLINPESIAFFGASNNIRSMGSVLMNSVRDLGYEGRLYPVHPREDEVQGYQAYRDVAGLPEVPDLAVLVLPTDQVNFVLEACGRKGIRQAIVVSGGFKEVGGSGIEREGEMKDIAARYGMRLLGPNCIGVANPHIKLNTTPIFYEGRPGFIGLASQSGSFITQMFNYVARMGMGFSAAFSVGNEAVTDLVDCLEYLGACPKTRVIALYVEGITRGREFVEMARSIVPHKPIVAFYVGGSEAGKKAGLSHTGAMAGPDRLYDGIFRQGGVLRADNLAELFDFCLALGSMPLPQGRRVVIQTHSGGPGAAAADACGRAGLDLPALSPETIERLSGIVPSMGSLKNPVDITFTKDQSHFYRDIPEALLQEPNADAIMTYFIMPAQVMRKRLFGPEVPDDEALAKVRELIDAQAAGLADMLARYRKPLVGFTWRGIEEDLPRGLLDRGVPVFPGPERAARALAATLTYRAFRDRISGARDQSPADPPAHGAA